MGTIWVVPGLVLRRAFRPAWPVVGGRADHPCGCCCRLRWTRPERSVAALAPALGPGHRQRTQQPADLYRLERRLRQDLERDVMAAPAITVPGTVSRHWKTGHVSALPAWPGSPRREDDTEEVTAQQVDDRVHRYSPSTWSTVPSVAPGTRERPP